MKEKENVSLRNKLSQVREEFKEMIEEYETDKDLWSNKFNHLLEDNISIKNEYLTLKNYYTLKIEDLS